MIKWNPDQVSFNLVKREMWTVSDSSCGIQQHILSYISNSYWVKCDINIGENPHLFDRLGVSEIFLFEVVLF